MEIGHAISADGINWTKDPSNPIFIITDGVPWRVSHILAPSVVLASNNTCSEILEMWFSGGNTNSNKRMGFATLCLPPIVLSVVLNFGFTSGGNAVNITGDFFSGTTSVLFGSTPATSFVINSERSITATVPPGFAGMVDVTVITTHGTSSISPADVYTYISNPIPLPPSNFIGIIRKNKFLNKTECILKAKWDASPSANVVLYRIYKNGELVEEISATSPLVFNTYLRHCSAKGFEITTVNSNSLESSPINLRIVHE